MRAKFKLTKLETFGETQSVTMMAVTDSPFDKIVQGQKFYLDFTEASV